MSAQDKSAELHSERSTLLEKRELLQKTISESEAQIESIPESLQSLIPTIRAGILMQQGVINEIDERLKKIDLGLEQERYLSLNKKVIYLVGEHVTSNLTDEEIEMLVKRSSLCVTFKKNKDGKVEVTSSIGTSMRPARGTSVDKPGEARERGSRRMIIDSVLRRQFSTWRGVLDAYGINPNGSSALKVAANMFRDFDTRFVDVDGVNFVQELLDKTVPYTIGSADDAYVEGFIPAEIYGGKPLSAEEIPLPRTNGATPTNARSAEEETEERLPDYLLPRDTTDDDYPDDIEEDTGDGEVEEDSDEESLDEESLDEESLDEESLDEEQTEDESSDEYTEDEDVTVDTEEDTDQPTSAHNDDMYYSSANAA